MSDQFIANWIARPKLRHALGYLLAVASVGLAFVAARTFLQLRTKQYSTPEPFRNPITEKLRTIGELSRASFAA